VTHRHPTLLFPGGKAPYLREGKPMVMDKGGVQKTIKLITRKCGISKNVHIHTLRHSFATPKEWNADCEHVGKGSGALTYLARYLYRGVIREKNILRCQNSKVTFRYKDSTTGQYQNITESAAQFLWRIIQHVLPKGFRRARDYGFLHGNAKPTLQRIQLMLKVIIAPSIPRHKAAMCCPDCGTKLNLIWLKRNKPIRLISRTQAAMDCA
jgi:hypothetical protein